jgi:hypothetical protein
MLRELVGRRLTADWTGRVLVGSGGDQGLESELRGMITGRTVFSP